MDSEVNETLRKSKTALESLLAMPDSSGLHLRAKVTSLSLWTGEMQKVVETLQKAGTESERLEAATKQTMQDVVKDLSTQKSLDKLHEQAKNLSTQESLDTLREQVKDLSTQKSLDTLHEKVAKLTATLDGMKKERSLRTTTQGLYTQAESNKQNAIDTAQAELSTMLSRVNALEQFEREALQHARTADGVAHEQRERIRELEQKADHLQNLNGELSGTLTERQAEITKLQGMIEQATTERATLNEELSRLQGIEIGAREEIASLERTIPELDEQVRQLKNKGSEMPIEIDNLKQETRERAVRISTLEDLAAGKLDLEEQLDAMLPDEAPASGLSPQEKFDKLIETVDGLKSQVDLIARAYASKGDTATSDPRKRQRVSSDPEQQSQQPATDWAKASGKVSERLATLHIFDDKWHDNVGEVVMSFAFVAADDEKWERFAKFVELAKPNEVYCAYQMMDDKDCEQPDNLGEKGQKCSYHPPLGEACYRAKCIMRTDVKEFIVGKKRPSLRV